MGRGHPPFDPDDRGCAVRQQWLVPSLSCKSYPDLAALDAHTGGYPIPTSHRDRDYCRGHHGAYSSGLSLLPAGITIQRSRTIGVDAVISLGASLYVILVSQYF